MLKQVIFSGFGGQGVLLAGQLLATAGLLEGREVTWFPSYGAEMRGGSANCTVVVSDQPIGSPVASRPELVLAFNQPALETFQGRVAQGGELIYNSSLAVILADLPQISAKAVPATEIAVGLGEARAVNLVMLGALWAATDLVGKESLLSALSEKLGQASPNLLAVNRKALEAGAEAYRGGAG